MRPGLSFFLAFIAFLAMAFMAMAFMAFFIAPFVFG
jgi:hypothetical protein